MRSLLFFLTEFLKIGIGSQRIPDGIESEKSTVLMSGRRDRYLSYSVKSFQTLHLNDSDQMAQFVFDVARHGDGMSDLLAQ